MTIQDLVKTYHENGGKPRVIESIKNKREALAFRKFLMVEIYRHLGDVVEAMKDAEALTKDFNLDPVEGPDFSNLHIFTKVR